MQNLGHIILLEVYVLLILSGLWTNADYTLPDKEIAKKKSDCYLNIAFRTIQPIRHHLDVKYLYLRLFMNFF